MKNQEQEIREQLNNCNGTEQYYRNTMFPKFTYTDGVREVCILCESYWILTEIFALCQRLYKNEEFIVIEFYKSIDEDSASLIFTDGNDNQIASKKILFTDFPLNNITEIKNRMVTTKPAMKFYFTNRVLLLPSEY